MSNRTMSLKHTAKVLTAIVALLNGAICRELRGEEYGATDYISGGYSTYHSGQQQLPLYQKKTSIIDSFVSGLKRTLLGRPAERQGPDRQGAGLGGLASAIQGAAIPLTIAAVAAVQRDQILNAITTTAATTTVTTTIPDYCSGITCTGDTYNTCDTNSGLCKCGTAGACGPPAVGSNRCDSTNNVCKCADLAVCATTTQPECLKKATTQDACASDKTATNDCICQCTTDAQCMSDASSKVCCAAGVAGLEVAYVGTCVAAPATTNCKS